ncbi:hypothetical protein KIS4809_4643 [Bacillus sp. ZZV12-4809]|nr:hypothetical protein KIS4809_4643 [Bacillus sp. ZZV12-4809]
MFGLGKRSQQPKEIRGEIVESVDDKSGKVLVHIDKYGREVTIKIRSRVDAQVIFECEYETDANERAAYYDAEQIVDIYLRAHRLYEDTRLSNFDIGYVRNASKRSR